MIAPNVLSALIVLSESAAPHPTLRFIQRRRVLMFAPSDRNPPTTDNVRSPEQKLAVKGQGRGRALSWLNLKKGVRTRRPSAANEVSAARKPSTSRAVKVRRT